MKKKKKKLRYGRNGQYRSLEEQRAYGDSPDAWVFPICIGIFFIVCILLAILASNGVIGCHKF